MGQLGRSRGVKGELWVTPLTDFPERFESLRTVFVEDGQKWKIHEVEMSKTIGNRPVLKLAGIDTREAAALMTNRKLAVKSESLVKLPEGTHYLFELIGCDVYSKEGRRLIGKIVDVLRYPANDVYLIRNNRGEEILFPAVKDFVESIDAESGEIVVDEAGLAEQSGDQT